MKENTQGQQKPKLMRITTVPMSLKHLLRGQMQFMQANGFNVIMVSSFHEELSEISEYEKCKAMVVEIERSIDVFKDIKTLLQLYRLIRQEKPAIVHTHTPKAGLLGMIASKIAGVPIRIHTIAGLRFVTTKGLMRKVLVLMEMLTGWCATHVWPNSITMKSYLEENKLIKKKKLEVIMKGSTNGIDLTRYDKQLLDPLLIEQTKRAITYDPSCKYIIAIGRIVRDKGIEDLVTSFIGVYQNRPEVRLVLIGKFEQNLDPISEQIIELIKNHNAIIHVEWSSMVEYYLSIGNLFVHASYREGFPNVLLQAGAIECPIICSDIPGNIDIVNHLKTGYLYEVGNIKKLKNAIHWALDHPNEMKEYATKLLVEIRDSFDQVKIHQTIKEKYEKLLSNAG